MERKLPPIPKPPREKSRVFTKNKKNKNNVNLRPLSSFFAPFSHFTLFCKGLQKSIDMQMAPHLRSIRFTVPPV